MHLNRQSLSRIFIDAASKVSDAQLWWLAAAAIAMPPFA
jgi:hypothetical protein